MELAKKIVKEYISNFNYESAQFLAEQSMITFPNDEELQFLVAKIYFLQGHLERSKDTLFSTSTYFPTVLLYSQCCFQLGRAFWTLGQSCLKGWIDLHSEQRDMEMAVALGLMGLIERRIGRIDEARRYLTEAVELDPLNMQAYLILAEIGENVELEKIKEEHVERMWAEEGAGRKEVRVGVEKRLVRKGALSVAKPKEIARKEVKKVVVKRVTRAVTSSNLGPTLRNGVVPKAVAKAVKPKPKRELAKLFNQIGLIVKAAMMIASYRANECLDITSTIDENHYDSCFVLTIVFSLTKSR